MDLPFEVSFASNFWIKLCYLLLDTFQYLHFDFVVYFLSAMNLKIIILMNIVSYNRYSNLKSAYWQILSSCRVCISFSLLPQPLVGSFVRLYFLLN